MRCLNRSLVLLAFAGGVAVCAAGQSISVETLKQLYDEKQWPEIVRAAGSSVEKSPEVDLYMGLAYAQMKRWEEAKTAFEEGERKSPRSERFPIELAGVAYRMNDFGEAEKQLKRALDVAPNDSYALNFLGTIYLLQGNLQAALKYWNRIEAPYISQVKAIPEPRLNSSLFAKTVAVSPLSILRMRDLEITEAQIKALGIFPVHRWELQPQSGSSYDLVFHSIEDNGWGANKWAGALTALRGLPYQTVYPQFHNGGRRAINLDSLVRWDSQKRRLDIIVSTPLESSPRWKFDVRFDGRDENWNLVSPFNWTNPPLATMKLRKLEFAAEIGRIQTEKLTWHTGARFSRRTFSNLIGATPQAQTFFQNGNTAEWNGGADYRLVSIPDFRFSVDSSATSAVGKRSTEAEAYAFGSISGDVHLHWFPQATGDDYEIDSRFRSGVIFGDLPFDEMFTLGEERDDNDLSLRGVSAVRDGRKGNSPMGRRYLLWNLEWNKVIYRGAFFEVKVGPAFDAGIISDPSGYFGSRGWLWDPGAQCKVRVLDTIDVVFSYGHDVRTAQNTFLAATHR